MRDPVDLGYLTGKGFQSAASNIEEKWFGLQVSHITFRAHPKNKGLAVVGYSNLDPQTGFGVLDILSPGEVHEVSRTSGARTLTLGLFGVQLENPSERVLVTARVD